jgi:hypothetical protein
VKHLGKSFGIHSLYLAILLKVSLVANNDNSQLSKRRQENELKSERMRTALPSCKSFTFRI